jgi:hypothetical protein
MSRYKVVPSQDNNRDYDGEFYDDDDDDDMELQRQYDEPSIISITVSRKEKPDGSIVRLKETFLSDGTSYQEETLVPRRKPAEATTPVTNQRQQGRHEQPHHDTGNTLASSFSTSKTKHHSMEYLPLDHYSFEPMTIQANTKLPQSRNPQTRLLWYLLCRCTMMMVMLLLLCVIIFSFLWWNNADGVMEFLHTFFNT